jgi:type IV secretory pathway protease TraF
MPHQLFGWPMYLALGAWVAYLLPTVIGLLWQLPTPFLLQMTDSEPRGLYRLLPLPDRLTRGTLVTLSVPPSVAALVFEHGWLPRHWHGAETVLVKPVAALEGDEFCVDEAGVSINRIWQAPVYRELGGVTLPVLRGCWTLQPDQVLLLSTKLPSSFDGRYLGVVHRDVLQQQAVPFWIWE